MYVFVFIFCIYLRKKYNNIVREKTNEYLENRQKAIAVKLQEWNDSKFREDFLLEWSVGMFGSYVEIAVIEGRPEEKVNYSFPPRVEVSKFA